jgi:hypothetical protein
MVKGTAGVNYQKVREELMQAMNIKITWFSARPDENAPGGKRIIELIEGSILDKVIANVFDSEMPKAGEAAKVKEGEGLKLFDAPFTVSYKLSLKDEKKRNRGSIDIRYTAHQTLEVKDAPIGAGIQIAKQPEEVKKVMFLAVKQDDFFNAVKIICNPNIDPKPFNMKSLKFIFQYKNNTKECNFLAAKAALEPASQEDTLLHFAMDHKASDKIKYQVEMTVQQGIKVSTVTGPTMTLEAQNGMITLGFTPEKLGLDIPSVDTTDLKFQNEIEQMLQDAKEGEKPDLSPQDYPSFVTVQLSHGTRKFSMKVTSENKGLFVWPIANNEQPVTCKIVGKFKGAPQTREYARNREPDLRKGISYPDIIVTNDDFEK